MMMAMLNLTPTLALATEVEMRVSPLHDVT